MTFEVTVVWGKQLFAHEASSLQEAAEWRRAYRKIRQAAVRVWRVKPERLELVSEEGLA